MATNNSRNNRTYRGTYTSKDGQKHLLNVKVFKRLGVFALTIVLVKTAHTYIIIPVRDTITASTNKEIEEENPDLALIENIIKANPDIIKIFTKSEYTVKNGDTVSAIAEECGNTVRRICALNGMSSKDIIYPGQVLNVEIITEKEPLDKEISLLESYFYDYLFNSNLATIARENSAEGSQLYRTILYGNPKTEADVDPNSIYGTYVTNYLHFHKNSKVDDTLKNEYLAILQSLAKDTVDQFSLGGTPIVVTPVQFKIYIENGTTKYDELQNFNHSIYA